MRICFIVGAFPKIKCGVGDYCYRLTQELSKDKENEIFVITSKKASNDVAGVKVYNIIEKWNLSATKTLIKTLKDIKPDIVNIQYPSNEYDNAYYTFSIMPLLIKLLIRCKLTETFHEYDEDNMSKQRKIRFSWNFKLMDKVIVVEKYFIDRIKRDFPKTDISYVPISSNVPRVVLEPEEKDKIRSNLKIKAKYVISFFGFVSPKKGLENLFEALSKIDDTQLLIIGELNDDDEYHNKLKTLIQSLGIEDKVIITGYIHDHELSAKYLSASDVCVLPFLEGVHRRNGSFLAAYNQFIPVITTTNDIKEDKEGIYYVAPNNTDELATKIRSVLSKKEKICRKELKWTDVACHFLDVLKSIER